MEVAELVLKYVRVLVWPVVTLILVWSLRAQLRAALARMTRVETPAGAIEFATEAREVLNEAQGAADAGAVTPPAPPWPAPPAPAPDPVPLPRTPRYGPAPTYGGGPQAPAPAGSAPDGPQPEPVPAWDVEPEDDEEPSAYLRRPDAGAFPGPQPGGGPAPGPEYAQPGAGPVPSPGYGAPGPSNGGYGFPRAPQPHFPPQQPSPPWQEQFREARGMTEASPVGAVVTAWNALNRLCLDVLAALPVVPPPGERPAEVGRALAVAGLSPRALAVLDRLRLLRDRAVHGAGDVTAVAARDFVDSCRTVAREVAALRRP
ncbi:MULTISPECIES: hypothetical protein [unclassified Streptomyces]|uniref:hypothetical protein n=1 Tax=unclassified Streptomyces TaxID=2593676 RepID=UPI00068A11AF|nr:MULTISPECIES: hypothetical protein [unclassified Streptomyces]